MAAATDPRAAGRPMYVSLDWIERHCAVPDGFRKGAPLRLYRYQGEYLRNFYLVRPDTLWVPENPILAPAFVYRRALLAGPQKVGKNPLIATQVCLEAVGPALFGGWAGKDDGYVCADHGCLCGWEYAYEPGEPRGMPWPTPLITITAFSEDSTGNTYDALRPMIKEGPLADLLPHVGEELIRLPGGGEIGIVTSSNQSRLGQRTTFVPQDELGLWTALNKMVKLADTQWRNTAGMGGRAACTSNAWDPAENSVAQQLYDGKATDVYKQFVQPPKNLSYANKAERRKIHESVYPLDTRRENGGHVDLNSIEAEAADLAERDPNQAERFFGNRLVAGAGHAVDPDHWDNLARADRGRPPTGTRVGGGFDGSIYQDATVIRGCTPDGFGFIWKAWEKPDNNADLQRWLREHPGKKRWEVDRQEVETEVDAFFAYFDVGLMLCDTPRWRTEIEGWADKYRRPVKTGEPPASGERVMAFDTNVKRRMAPAFDRWLVGVANGTHTHDGDPLTTRHVKAMHRQKVHLADQEDDGRTMYIPVKGSDKERIDAAVTDILAHEAAMTMPAAPPAALPPMFGFGGRRKR